MSSKTIRSILILMLLIIGALFITQTYWFKKAFSLQEQQLDEKINITLRNVAHQLLVLENDTSRRIPPITQLSSNQYYVRTNSYFTLTVLDSILRKAFISNKLEIEYQYLILKSQDKELILGNSVTDFWNTSEIACKTREDVKEKLDFKLHITNKSTYLLNAMGVWMYSTITLLVILMVFIFIMISIVKGKRLEDLKKDFVNNMTHELKTPIANISVASDAIRNDRVQMDEVKLKKYANIIYKENVRLLGLVDKVLQISAIEKQDESLTFEIVDLHSIITTVLLRFDPVIQQRNGSINAELKADKFTLQADKLHLSNVVYNLIENAIKYSKDHPEITLTTSSTKDGINVEVSDKGIGINKNNQHRIFEHFFRAETGNLHNTKGFGLGLSYVKLIVEKHHGLLTFTSKENVGSTFKVFLPL